jgi:hypothetical protein
MDQIQPQLVYESPDGGKTVYARQFGESKRTVVFTDPETENMLRRMQREMLWTDILEKSETNQQLSQMLEQIEIYYRLIREDKSNNII